MMTKFKLLLLLFFISSPVIAQTSAEEFLLNGVQKHNEKSFDEAIEKYNQALALKNQFPEAFYNRGLTFMAKRKYEDAISDFNKAVSLRPAYAKGIHNRAIAKMSLGRFSDAMSDLNSAIKLQPQVADFYFNRANLKNYLEDYSGASSDYKKAYSLNTSDKQSLKLGVQASLLASKQRSQKDTLNKIAHADKRPVPNAQKEPPESTPNKAKNTARFDIESTRSLLENAKKDMAKPDTLAKEMSIDSVQVKKEIQATDSVTVKDISNVVKDSVSTLPKTETVSDSAAFYNKEGITLSAQKKYLTAIKNYNKAIAMSATFSKAYYNRGIAKSQLEDFIGAINDYNKAIELKPDFAEAYYNRGIARYSSKDKVNACLDFSKAGELGAGDAYELIKLYCH